jgi:hypothetical protein
MMPITSCKTNVVSILYSDIDTAGMRYGRQAEKDAIVKFEEQLKLMVIPCGLYIDKELPQFAASPDGLVGEDAILEIKSPSSAMNITPAEAIRTNKVKYCLLNEDGRSIKLKTSDKYMFQVQGQLHITGRRFCYFVLNTKRGILVDIIERNDLFWETEMEEKLKKFNEYCLLLELLDPRYPRKMPIRDPEYILQAKKNHDEAKKKAAEEKEKRKKQMEEKRR